MNRLFVLFAFVLFSFALHAAPPKIAVMDVEDKTGTISKTLADEATEFIRSELVSSNRFTVISKDAQRQARIKEEKKKTWKEQYDKAQRIQLGKSLAADTVLTTTVTKFGSKFTVTLELVDLASEATLKGAKSDYDGSEEGLQSALGTALAVIIETGAKLGGGGSAAATDNGEEIRTVVVPSIKLEGKDEDAALLEALVISKMQNLNYTIVDPGAAVRAKRVMVAEELEAGRIPKELSVLEADAALAVRLSCNTAAGQIGTSKLKSFSCALTAKMIRIENGEVAFSNMESLPAFGLTGAQAIQTLIEKKAGPAAEKLFAAARGKWSAGGAGLDLMVTRLRDRGAAEKLLDDIKKRSGGGNVALVVFNTEYVKYRVTGGAPGALKKALFTETTLPITVVHETANTVHLRYDAAKTFAPRVAVLYTVSGGTMPDDAVAGVVSSLLRNVEYLSPTGVSKGSPDRGKRIAAAKKSGANWALLLDMTAVNGAWQVAAEVVATAGGDKLLSTAGKGDTLITATRTAIGELAAQFSGKLDSPQAAKYFTDAAAAKSYQRSEPVTVEQFAVSAVSPALMAYYRNNGVGALTLTNRSAAKLSAKIEFSIDGAVSGTQDVADLKPGEARKITVGLNMLPAGSGKRYTQIQAAVAYAVGETRQRTDAYAPLLLLEENTIDWNDARTLAAFIDPQDSTVRNLATAALSGIKPPAELLTDRLGKAALLFGALWHKPLSYVSDPVDPGANADLDTVQYPAQTLVRKAGDCDDLTVLFASLLESVGIPAAVITVPGHVLVAAETQLLAGGHLLLGLPKELFIEIDGALYAPIEATAIGASFAEAWAKGAEAVKKGGTQAAVFRVREAWKKYPAAGLGRGGKAGLSAQKPAASGIIATLRKGAGAVPAAAVTLHERMAGGEKKPIDAANLKDTPIAQALTSWLNGDPLAAVKQLDALCEKGRTAACYDLALLALFDTGEKQTGEGLKLEDAVAVLPAPVIDMLIDSGGWGMGDESSPEAKQKRQLQEALKKARDKMKDYKGPQKVKVSHVAGRKGADFTGRPDIFKMLFWDNPAGK